jgi:hypothetical protein
MLDPVLAALVMAVRGGLDTVPRLIFQTDQGSQ